MGAGVIENGGLEAEAGAADIGIAEGGAEEDAGIAMTEPDDIGLDVIRADDPAAEDSGMIGLITTLDDAEMLDAESLPEEGGTNDDDPDPTPQNSLKRPRSMRWFVSPVLVLLQTLLVHGTLREHHTGSTILPRRGDGRT